LYWRRTFHFRRHKYEYTHDWL